jgi:hypothetical protein
MQETRNRLIFIVNFVMCMDNMPTQALIATFGWEQFDHPHYSPDLTPSDFHVFLS